MKKPSLGHQPSVGIAIAARNEGASITPLLDSLSRQSYPRHLIRVAIADGSEDSATAQAIDEWCSTNELDVERHVNHQRTAPAGFTQAVKALDTEIIIILGAHAVVDEAFVANNVATLVATGADCVGGALDTQGRSPTGRAVAAAMSSPFGVGNARFRIGGRAGEVDTVAFGAYPAAVFQQLGGFDADLVGAEDDEFNFRLRQAGGKIWFDPEIRSTYYCRDSLGAVWRQYRGYGKGKALVLLKHRQIPTARMLVPPTFVAGLAGSVLLSLGKRRLWPVSVVAGAYVAGVAVAGLTTASRCGTKRLATVATFPTLHLSYGTGLLEGLIVGVGRLLGLRKQAATGNGHQDGER